MEVELNSEQMQRYKQTFQINQKATLYVQQRQEIGEVAIVVKEMPRAVLNYDL